MPLVTKRRSQHRLPKVAVVRRFGWPLTPCRQGSQKREAGQGEMRQLKEEALGNHRRWGDSGLWQRQKASQLLPIG